MKIRYTTLIMLLVFYSCFRIYIVEAETHKQLTLVLLTCSFIYLVSRHAKVHWTGLLLAIIIIFTSIGKTGMLSALLFAGKIIDIFMLADLYNQRNESNLLIRDLYSIVFVYILLNLVFIFINNGALYKTNIENVYLIGNKFVVSYLGLLFLALYRLKYGDYKHFKYSKKFFYLLFILYNLLISLYVECSTGVVATVLFVVFDFLLNTGMHKILCQPITLMIILFVGNFAIIVTGIFLDIPIIQDIIVNVLHEDLTLTGRTAIYANIKTILESHWITGYGYGNSAVNLYMGYGNAQNGILEVIVENGLLGAGGFLILLGIAYTSERTATNDLSPLIAILYTLIICSFVEITFGILMIMLCAMLINLYRTDHKSFYKKGKYNV